MAFIDITDQRFGRLVAVSRGGDGLWLCRCDCGSLTRSALSKLRSGHVKSCGCYRAECNRTAPRTHGKSRHGEHRLYTIWMGMRGRCNSPRSSAYPRYGARGIRVCAEWDDFEAFERWALDNGYRDNMSIDRIDVNGNYERGNCRWATRKVQSRNTRRTILAEVNGKTACLKDHAIDAGVSYWALVKLVQRKGLSAQDAVNRLKAQEPRVGRGGRGTTRR